MIAHACDLQALSFEQHEANTRLFHRQLSKGEDLIDDGRRVDPGQCTAIALELGSGATGPIGLARLDKISSESRV
ncbi:protein of unknown function (plasmid) [Methylocella tundrae]|uniref:Uncharacterized protein n=1 Tax=Methylocella tundrae TaxID=227605 RepID=A0A4U8Z6Q7_METTU|nr:protein of unknown function [Methylocella tundrae]